MEKIKKTIDSFGHALRGFRYALRRERNFQIEILAAVFVLATMVVLPLEKWEIVVLILMVVLVLVLELLNTFAERLINLLKPRIHPQARVLKDIMATAVFIASLAAAVVGLVIFLPYF